MKKYGAKYRAVYNEETKEMRKVFNPIIYREDGKEMFISSNGELLEFRTKGEAVKKAKETYERFKGKLWE